MSRIREEMHELARDMYEAGVFSEEQIRKYDVLCPPEVPSFSPEEIKEIRARYNLSQKSLAALLNVSISTVQKWETGAKNPMGAARKLLDLLEKKGVAILI